MLTWIFFPYSVELINHNSTSFVASLKSGIISFNPSLKPCFILSARDPDVTGVVAYSRRHDPHFRNPSLQRYNEEVGERLADCAIDRWIEQNKGNAANSNVEGIFGVQLYSRLSRGRSELVFTVDSERKDRIVSPSELQYHVLRGN